MTRVVAASRSETVKKQAPIVKLDSLNSGFAARCEARLCLAVRL